MKITRILAAIGASLCLATAMPGAAMAQLQYPDSSSTGSVGTVVLKCLNASGLAIPVGPLCANPVPVTAGPYSYSPSSTASNDQHNLAITTATALTVPADATFAQVCVTGTKVNYRWDGNAPTGSVGQPLSSGQCFFFQGRNILTALQFIQTAATATLDVTYSK